MPLNTIRFTRLLAPVLVLTLAIASFSIYRRNQVESENRATALAAEYETVEALAGGQGITMDKAIVDLQAQGLNTLVLSEETIGELISEGKIAMESSSFGGNQLPVVRISSLRFNDLTIVPQVQRALQVRFHSLVSTATPRGDVLGLPPISQLLIRSTSAGIDPLQADFARKHHMMIVVRLSNSPGLSAATVRDEIAWAKQMGAKVFLPQGDQVLGRRDALDVLIQALKDNNVLYASPEFAKMGGDEDVLKQAPEMVVRLHSAQVAELDKLSPKDAVDRYAKASRERNMRILLIRPLSAGADKPLSDFADFVTQIDHEIVHEGGVIGAPHPYTEPNVPHAYFPILGLAIAAVIWLALGSVGVRPAIHSAMGILLGLIGLACWTRHGQQVMALAAAVSFSAIGFILLDYYLPKTRGPEWARILFVYALVSVVSVIGGLCVAALLNGLAFYVKADEFRGIKLAVFFPILLVGGFYAARLTDWKAVLRSPITWGASAIGILLMVAILFMLARTGNDTGASASGEEIQFRGFLENILFVRPRTKEFLVGHPALILGIGLLLRTLSMPRRASASGEEMESPATESSQPPFQYWAVLAFMVGAIGQTSVVNTLCHLHIPVMLSLGRIGLGWVFGCMIGLVLWAIVSRVVPRREA